MSVAVPAAPARTAIAVALAFALGLAGSAPRPLTAAVRGGLAVTTCADSGSGSLRDAVAAAVSGDEIAFGALDCSTISLVTGAIVVDVDDLSLTGPGAGALAVEGNYSDRVFEHRGAGTLFLSGLTVRDGLAVASGYDPAEGGCIRSTGTVALESSVVSHCTSSGELFAYGGGIRAGGATITHSRVEQCLATIEGTGGYARGGGIAVTYGAGDLLVARSVITQNSAIAEQGGGAGGGVFFTGTNGGVGHVVSIVDSTLDANAAVGAPYVPTYGSFGHVQGMGGALYSGAYTTISGSTIASNEATSGGGIALFAAGYGAQLALSNSTISGNTALSEGGGLWVMYAGFEIDNSTIAFNHAQYGGGGIMPRHPVFQYLYDNPPTIRSSIVASNTSTYANVDIFTDLTALPIIGANTLIVDSSLAPPDGNIALSAQLLPLADNWGPTRTHALADTSPAIDAGSNVDALVFDQRGSGFPRTTGAAVDIGSYEADDAADRIFRNGFE